MTSPLTSVSAKKNRLQPFEEEANQPPLGDVALDIITGRLQKQLLDPRGIHMSAESLKLRQAILPLSAPPAHHHHPLSQAVEASIAEVVTHALSHHGHPVVGTLLELSVRGRHSEQERARDIGIDITVGATAFRALSAVLPRGAWTATGLLLLGAVANHGTQNMRDDDDDIPIPSIDGTTVTEVKVIGQVVQAVHHVYHNVTQTVVEATKDSLDHAPALEQYPFPPLY